ncbi:MAG: hypothetical protein EOO50_03210 [Flavobacterium sp.]|uniref:BatD family protein n=1 Tax=Flavobacterium sp. TaxID=239 RepID=UPI001223CA63|nr:BatD family protein [Flavobacterium sp.]RZJ68110.1 MAG: hypothetical protein EOO50_03210 [Flavobacterium sp.]
MKRIALVILSLFCMHGLRSQDVVFTAKTSKAQMSVSDTISVEFTTNVDGENFTQPEFVNFDVVAGPSQRVSQSWLKGEKSYSKHFRYVLKARNVGKAEIGKASMDYDRKTYSTSPIFIDVKEKIEGFEVKKRSDSVYFKIEISKTAIRLDETAEVIYKLYLPGHVGLYEWNETSARNPDLQIVPADTSAIVPIEEEINGEKYRWIVFQKVLIKPKKVGILKIEPRTFTFEAEIGNRKRDFFGRQLTDKKTIQVTTEARQITVTP